MKWIKKFSTFLFDFDGLLVNTEEIHFAAFRELCRINGFSIPWDFFQYCEYAHYSSTGLRDATYEEFPKLQAQHPDWHVFYVDKKRIYQDLIETVPLEFMHGVPALLEALKKENIPRAVATNSTKQQIDVFKRRMPLLQTIPLWVTREDYEKAKPNPDAYLTALDKLQGKNAIGFEDSFRGIQALQKAKVPPVLICPEEHPQLENPELVNVPFFSSFEEIPDEGPLLG